MIHVYKIGLQHYVKNEQLIDKNSGVFEYDIICKELSTINTSKKVLVIINGKLSELEETTLLQRMRDFDVKIFIASDIIAFEENSKIINACDYLLHQCPNNTIEQFANIKQFYSYVPELFYKYVKLEVKNSEKIDKIIFGGGVRGNEKLIFEYLSLVPSTLYIKTNDADTRLPYFEYLEELAKHKYSFVISRKQYNDLGWVTARFPEALALNTLPLCESKYDKHNGFYSVKINSAEQIRDVMRTLENDSLYNSVLNYAKLNIEKNINNFKKLIINIIGEKTCK